MAFKSKEPLSLEELFKQAKEFFETYNEITCPAFPKEKIKLNGKGIEHLFNKGSRSPRTIKEVNRRISLLPRAIKLLEIASIWQEEEVNVPMKYWSFEGVIDYRRIKVIIRQKGAGLKHFYSVIPKWRKTRFGVRNSDKKLSKQ